VDNSAGRRAQVGDSGGVELSGERCGPPQVPGFDAVELLGFGASGEVWLAQEQGTGARVALKRLASGAGLEGRDRLRREAAVLAGVDHPHVVRLRAVHGDGDDVVLVLDLAAGGSLARLLATRGRLTPGEVVTVGVPLAEALAAVHGQGLLHGDVTPGNVLFTADGRPVLSDLGVSRLLGVAADAQPPVHGTCGYLAPEVMAGGAPGPAADVHGLAATCVAALTGLAPYDDHGRRRGSSGAAAGETTADRARQLVDVLERALDPDPDARPSAKAFALALFEAAAAEPVRLPRPGADLLGGRPPVPVAATHRVRRPASPPADVPASAEHPGRRRGSTGRRIRRRRRAGPPRRAVAWAVAGVLALGVAVVTGVTWAGAAAGPRPAGPHLPAAESSSGPSSTLSPRRAADEARTEPTAGWVRVLTALDTARSRAFAAGDEAALSAVYLPTSPAGRRDAAELARLAGAGVRAAGLRLDTTSVRLVGRSPGRVQLRVTDVLPAYRLVDARGRVVAQPEGRGARTWTVVLGRAGSRGPWRVYDVVRR
jgi:eukaryotic-like serine/threonine-protein kinase